MNLADVTPLIITHNEEANIDRTLAALTWASRIVVVDSGSTDSTLSRLRRFASVELFHRPFDSFAAQCNYGLSLITTPWCLSLDADHVLSEPFRAEMEALLASVHGDVAAVLTPFRYLVHGRALRGSLLPPRFNLVRPSRGFYEDDGHAHRFVPLGPTAVLHQPILHDDRKPLSRWLHSQNRYLQQEASKLLHTPEASLSWADRLRKRHVIAPFAILVLCLIRHGGLLDGWRGWFYAFQRMYVEILLSLILWELRQAE